MSIDWNSLVYPLIKIKEWNRRLAIKAAKIFIISIKLRKTPDIAFTYIGLISGIMSTFPPELTAGKHDIMMLGASFSQYTDDEAEEAIARLENEWLPERVDTLREHIEKELGLKSADAYNPNDVDTNEAKLQMAMLASFNTDSREDFKLKLPDSMSDSQVGAMIISHYTDHGYECEQDYSTITAKKENERLIIHFSNFGSSLGNSLMVSVVPLKLTSLFL